MSRARKQRKAIRWARYFNHYAHKIGILIGGTSAHRFIVWSAIDGRHGFLYVRHQAKHRLGETL